MPAPIINYGNIITEIQMHEDEIAYVLDVCSKLPDDATIVEWGSGGSTCVWLDKLKSTQKLISIEHNKKWFDKVTEAIDVHFEDDFSDRFAYLYIPEEYVEHGYGNPLEEMPIGTAKYIKPPDKIFDSNVFFVDGIARGTCLLSILINHTQKDPVIFLHDYVGREEWFDWVTQFFNIEVVATTLLRLYIK